MDAIRRDTLPAAGTFGSDAALEFLAGVVTSVDDHIVSDLAGSDYDDQNAFTADSLLRDYANAQLTISTAETAKRGAPERTDSAVNQLRFENLFDRMLGYPPHIRAVLAQTFEEVDTKALEQVGFRLSTAVEIADAYSEITAAKYRRVHNLFGHVFDAAPAPIDEEQLFQQAATHVMGLARFGSSDLELDMSGMIAAYGGFDPQEVGNVLDALSTPIGSQPEFVSLGDNNACRYRPILKLADGRMLWTRPSDFIHCALDWAFHASKENTRLLTAFDKARQAACEQLTFDGLATGFESHAQVLKSPTYPADGQRPDIDSLVALPDAALVAEAKGGRLTEPGRRGAPERVKKKVGELIDYAQMQNERSIAYLRNDNSDLRTSGRQKITIDNPLLAYSLIVTLERVDPFYSFIESDDSNYEVPSLALTVHDLLLITELLPSPTELFGYLSDRCSRHSHGAPTHITEAGALEEWINGKRGSHLGGASDVTPRRRRIFSGNPDHINDYYADREIVESGQAVENPTPAPVTAVPRPVLEAADSQLRNREQRWGDLALAVCHVPDREWAPILRVIDRARSNPDRQVNRKARKKAAKLMRGTTLSTGLIVAVSDAGEVGLSLK
ncbi:hypothetical protein EV378_4584 [Pseudonocardia endophytica]|uniref:Uncharacterized protein n=2 Tax=Pseudonocardia endophytica TaxID=401976 RepID=A0A4R1HID6_PSEEN|nr:hypothetical protein EV378_4584 [Pseudonocardia endophytica]